MKKEEIVVEEALVESPELANHLKSLTLPKKSQIGEPHLERRLHPQLQLQVQVQ
jgi:hypothetical protein